MKKEYEEDHKNPYENALLKLNLQTLEQRRKQLCLNFAKKSIENGKLNDLFPENNNDQIKKLRYQEKFQVLHANTDRMRKSSIIYMQNLLNEEHKENTI